jgi:hypothetical protein
MNSSSPPCSEPPPSAPELRRPFLGIRAAELARLLSFDLVRLVES